MTEITKPETPGRKKAAREGGLGNEVALGSWWWIRYEKKKDGRLHTSTSKDAQEMLVCVTKLGSNFAEVETPKGSKWRLHLEDEFPDVTRPCPNYKDVIRGKVSKAQGEVQALMQQVHDETARIGLRHDGSEIGTALAVLSGQADVKDYEKSLVKSKEETLPALFKEIESATHDMKTWMKAELLPVRAVAESMKGCIKEIEGRIFNVEIYAGLEEKVHVVREGEPARADEKLHVFQSMLYMDEECLLDYRGGGMDFSKEKDFDRWLAKKENADRILPYPRCMVAMQVRRYSKDRSGDARYGGLLGAFMKFDHEQFDKETYLFVRNGERIYRIDSQMDFGHLIFPSRGEFSAEPLMFRNHGDKMQFITVRDYEVRKTKEDERLTKHEAWLRANPYREYRVRETRREWLAWKAERNSVRAERYKERMDARTKTRKVKMEVKPSKGEHGTVDYVPPVMEEVEESIAPEVHDEQAGGSQWGYRRYSVAHRIVPFESKVSKWCWERESPFHRDNVEDAQDVADWQPFDSRSTEFDEAKESLDKKLKKWNRTSLVIQGLYDRSEVLDPHPPVRLWDPVSFAENVEMIFDGEHVLHYGEPPDFEAYRRKSLESLGKGSFTIGQQAAWLLREQDKEQRRRDKDDRLQGEEAIVKSWWIPKGSSGPGFVAEVKLWRPNKREAVFQWERYSEKRTVWKEDPNEKGWGWKVRAKVKETITVPADELFNVSAYKPGDYKQFFADPRTRRDYIQWAPLLLTAEDWHAKKGKVDPEREMDEDDLDDLEPEADDEDDDEDEED